MKLNVFLLSTWVLVLTACAGGNNSFAPGNNQTGHSKVIRDTDTKTKVRANYTISGSRVSFARLVKELGSRTDVLLAQSVLDTNVQRLNVNDQEVEQNPAQLVITVRFTKTSLSMPEQIKLRARLSASSGGLRANEVVQDAPGASYFVGHIFCPQTDCKRVEIRLVNRTQSASRPTAGKLKEARNEVGILYSTSTPAIQLLRRRSAVPYMSSSLRSLESALPDSSAGKIHGRQKSVVVVEGPSFANVWLGGARGAAPVINLMAELFDTSTVVSEIKSAAIDGKRVIGRLVGNDSNRGDLMVEVADGNESAMLRIEKDKSDLDPEDKDDSIASRGQMGPSMEPGKAVFAVTSNDPKIRQASADLANYSQHPRTLEQVQWLLKNDPKGLKGFFTHAPNVTPIIGEVLQSIRVTPEFAYVLPVESSYLKAGTFNSTQVTGVRPSSRNRNPSAFGPWQIVNATAFSIKERSGENFNLHFIRQKQWDPNDDRGFLVQSTYMAGLYMSLLSDLFEHDRALAVLAYHAGEGCVGVAVNKVAPNSKGDCSKKAKQDAILTARLRTISKSEIDLALVNRYKMVPDESLEYAFRVLAWREIGQNPTKYGYGNIEPVQNPEFKRRLSRPGGPLPRGLSVSKWI